MTDPTARAVAQTQRLELFVPGKLVNPLNGSHGHWSMRARWARRWRERICPLAMIERPPLTDETEWLYQPMTPKRILFVARTWNAVDDDALPAMAKPARDGLRDAGLIHDDGPHSGHEFRYDQVIDRRRRGLDITVELVPVTE